MKIGVKLFGALPAKYGGSRHRREIELDIPEGAKTRDLPNHLNIQNQRDLRDLHHVVITREGRILQPGDELKDGDLVSMFQAMYGG